MTSGPIHPSISDILSAAVYSAMDGFTIVDCTDPETPLIYVNQAFEKITGYSREESVGKNCRFLQGEDSDAETISHIGETIRAGKDARVVIKNYRKDGAAFWNELYLSPILSGNNQITHYLGVQKDLSHTQMIYRSLSMASRYDALTGLQTKPGLLDYIDKYCGSQAFSLFFIRIEGIRAAETVFGSLRANELTINVAKLLYDVIKDNGSVFRIGDHDFCVIRHGALDEDKARQLSSDILQYFKTPFLAESGKVKLSVNIGVVPVALATSSPESLVQKAELAMTMSSDVSTSNTVDVYSDNVLEQTERTMRLLADLPGAIENNELYLVFQPQVNSDTGEVCGCEALVRWAHGELGAISPGEFIPLAERNEFIMELTCWVLTEVCSAQHQLARSELHDTISINLSPMLLYRSDIACQFAHIVSENNADASKIEIEVVENISADLGVRGIESLNQLKQHFSIAVDDFGTGYSSLSYLRKIPADKIKLDKSFIDEIEHDGQGRLMVKSLIELCKGLNFSVVAEGVENAAQHAFLKDSGCDVIQGFLYSVPKALSQYIAYRQHDG